MGPELTEQRLVMRNLSVENCCITQWLSLSLYAYQLKLSNRWQNYNCTNPLCLVACFMLIQTCLDMNFLNLLMHLLRPLVFIILKILQRKKEILDVNNLKTSQSNNSSCSILPLKHLLTFYIANHYLTMTAK